MLNTKISLSGSGNTIKALFSEEKIELPDDLFKALLLFLSKACTYEEEETRIWPSIIVCSNLLNNSVIKLLQATPIQFVEEPISKTNLIKRLKSALPFCNNGWKVFINVQEDIIQYGIIRNFNGPTGLSVDDVLLSLSDEEKESLKINFVLIDAVSNFELRLQTASSNCIVDFRLTDYEEESISKACFCEDLLSAYEGDMTKASIAYKKLVDLFSRKLHGSLCFIVKYDYCLPDGVFNDGIFLKKPIDFFTILDKDLTEKNQTQDISATISSHEKYHAFTGILIEMLNIDGITIVDNKGRIRAFNVFVKADTVDSNALSGGARKRAAHYLSSLKSNDYIGVYFQSQDGTSFYERIADNE